MAGIANTPGVTSERGERWRSRGRVALSVRHVRALLWLRWKLSVRGYTRGWRQIVGLIVMMLYLVPFSLGIGIGSAFAYILLPRAVATQVLFGILTLLYFAWAILPLLQYSLNEGLDVTKLQGYPLTRLEQMTSLVLSTLLDPTTLVILAVLVGAFVGWHSTPLAGAIIAFALALAYIHTVTLSQLALATLMGLLRSRRYRDLTIILFALLGVFCSVANQLAFRFVHFTSLSAFGQSVLRLRLDRYAQWLPPGMAARIIVLANAGNDQALLPWLVALVALVPCVLALWARVLDHGIITAETAAGGATRRGRSRATGSRERTQSGRSSGRDATWLPTSTTRSPRRAALISAPVRAIAQKELRYYWRDPQIKAMLLGSLFFLVVVFLPGIYGSTTPGGSLFTSAEVLYAPIPALYIVLNLSMNTLGLERGALQTLYLFPVRPLAILWGKNLAVGAISFTAQVVLVLALAGLSGGWGYVPIALVGGLAILLVLLGCGNVTSALLPFRMRQMRMGSGSYSSEAGWLRGLLAIVVLVVTLVLALPVVAAIGVPLLLGHREWLAATLVGSLVYGALLHQIASRLIAPYILTHASEILRVTAPER